ncbi:MAG: hypothetical protein FJ405_10020 [Verrucomicrobia bacterium]|nr:hypothetical protein [Verrucomicrobiota bacterium]
MNPLRTLGILCSFLAGAAVVSGADKVRMRTVHSQPSHVLANKAVEVAVTRLGGHMAPVTFFRDSAQPVQPYHISPWQDEKPTKMPAPVLVPLRGDFFCLPFGGNSEAVDGEKHPPHGEVASDDWKVVGTRQLGDVTTLSTVLETKVRKGRVTKELSLVDGHNVVYSRHIIDGFAGRVPLGHHATLAMPEKEGAVRIATSAFRFGMTYPSLFSDPRQREYQALMPGSMWKDLTKVPAVWKGAPDADLTRLPSRYGHADLIQLVHESWEKTGGPSWTTATFGEAGYLWFSLKDPAVLNSTVFWMENHGRHGHPWNGRNNCLGLEDVTAFFAEGLGASMRDNLLTQQGVVTAVTLSASQPTAVNYIQGVARIPAGFENVRTVEFAPGQVIFISTTGQRVTAPVRHEFLRTGKL